ncbi:Inositol transporter 4 [Armadillidium nasatum]|uniref:Inositol transporter 4 n=1 Tax=Armadillidium nasatum TaxID=96803 RepID=A0A5N5TCU5_9CRUS|nr:Inositol transporter 4 [Armadillidium nasatum]
MQLTLPHSFMRYGGGYELMIFVGMLFANCMGVPFKDYRWIGLACALIPCLCSFLMFFCKESPFYLLAYGKEKEAEDSLRFFRGKKYDGIDAEMKIIRESLEERMSRKAKFSDLMIPYNLKPFLMALGLMILQQFLGINAVTFNLASIFEEYNPALAEEIYWLPLISLVMYVVAYAIGSGPIPWLMMGELFSPEIKELAGSIVTLSNWTSAFVTTLMFQPLRTAMHDYGVYWMFCGFCFVKLFFVITFVYETKKKTLQEINAHFGKPPSVKVKDPKEEIFNSRL